MKFCNLPMAYGIEHFDRYRTFLEMEKEELYSP